MSTPKTTELSKVFLTGATGFIGSYIASALVEAGHPVLCLKRDSSKLNRCAGFSEKVRWINSEDNWCKKIAAEKPDIFIHAAWSGVTAAERDDWKLQMSNLTFFSDMLDLATTLSIKRFVALGSTAEYGQISGRITENHPCQPVSAYGAVKLACLTLLEKHALQNRFSYAWLRIFSTYGLGESEQWFIPSILKQFRAGQAPKLTLCEQRYDYLHVRDLAAGVLATIQTSGQSGVFNLTSNQSIALKEIVMMLKEFSGSKEEPHFGALPYRPNQSMRMEGDSTKFYKTFNFAPRVRLRDGLKELSGIELETATPSK